VARGRPVERRALEVVASPSSLHLLGCSPTLNAQSTVNYVMRMLIDPHDMLAPNERCHRRPLNSPALPLCIISLSLCIQSSPALPLWLPQSILGHRILLFFFLRYTRVSTLAARLETIFACPIPFPYLHICNLPTSVDILGLSLASGAYVIRSHNLLFMDCVCSSV